MYSIRSGSTAVLFAALLVTPSQANEDISQKIPQEQMTLEKSMSRIETLMQRVKELERRVERLEKRLGRRDRGRIDRHGIIRNESGQPIGVWGIDGVHDAIQRKR